MKHSDSLEAALLDKLMYAQAKMRRGQDEKTQVDHWQCSALIKVLKKFFLRKPNFCCSDSFATLKRECRPCCPFLECRNSRARCPTLERCVSQHISCSHWPDTSLNTPSPSSNFLLLPLLHTCLLFLPIVPVWRRKSTGNELVYKNRCLMT